MSNLGYEFDVPMTDAVSNDSTMAQDGVDRISTEGVLLAYDNRGSGAARTKTDKQAYKPMQPKLDPAGEIKPKQHAPIQGGVEQNESKILWDAWTNRVLKQALANVKAEIDKYTAATGEKFEQGIGPVVDFNVNSQGQVTGVQLKESSGDETYDALVVKALKKLAGNPILRFPQGSHRQSMSFDNYRYSTGNHTSNPNFHDNDEETVDS